MNSSNLYLYMAGDNNLDIAARKDIAQDLLGNSLSERTTVYVQFDRRAPLPWETELTEFTTKRFKITKGKKILLKELGETNSGDGIILSEFMNDCIAESKADFNFAIIWGHGGSFKAKYDFKDEGYKWVSIDNSSQDALSIRELVKSFNHTSINFDIIGFDACLMAVLELAYALKEKAKFMLASQAIEPPDGWCYKDLLSIIDVKNTGASPLLLKQLTTSYLNSYKNSNKSITLSGVDLSKVETVAKKRDEFANSLVIEFESYKLQYLTIANKVQRFEDKNYADLKHFVLLCTQSIPSQNIKEKAEELEKALNKFVCATINKGLQYKNAYGVSVLMPLSLQHPLPYHLEIHKNYPKWFQFIQLLLTI